MSTAPGRKAARPEPGREGLISTAIDCFARYGYAGTSIDRIAKSAGVTKGALYYHFRDKEALLFAAVRERIQAFEDHVLQRVAGLEDPAEALREIARICARIAATDNHRRFILTLMVEALDTNAALSAEFREMLRRFRSFHRHLIRTGQERGVFRRDIDVQRAAEAFVSALLGAEIQYYQDPQAVQLDESLDVHADLFLSWLVVTRPAADQTRGGR